MELVSSGSEEKEILPRPAMKHTFHRVKQVIRPVVERVELLALRVPFSAIARSAMDASDNGLGMAIPAEEPWEAGDFVYACLTDEAGETGWGEVFVWLPETGVSPAELVAGIGSHLARYVLGTSPFDVAARRARMDRNVARNEVPKGLYDLACHDLAARQVVHRAPDLTRREVVAREVVEPLGHLVASDVAIHALSLIHI